MVKRFGFFTTSSDRTSVIMQPTLNTVRLYLEGKLLSYARRRRVPMIAMTEVSHMLTVPKSLITFLGIRKAASWYNSHLSRMYPPIRGQRLAKVPQVVLLTQDVGNREKATAQDIPCASSMSSMWYMSTHTHKPWFKFKST